MEKKLLKILNAFWAGVKRLFRVKKKTDTTTETLPTGAAIVAAICFTIFDFTAFLICFFLAATLGLLVGLGEGIYRQTSSRIKLLLDGEVVPEAPSAFRYFLLLRATLKITPFCAAFHLWAMPLAFAKYKAAGAATVFAADATLSILATASFVKRFVGEMPQG